MLWANTANDKIDDYFLLFFFTEKKALKFHANCLPRRQFALNVKAYFLGKMRKNISKCHLLETFAQHAKSLPANSP